MVMCVSPAQYYALAMQAVAGGYAALPGELLAAERHALQADKAASHELNRYLCRALRDRFSLADAPWRLPAAFHGLYRRQLERIDDNLGTGTETYFSLGNDPFRKDLAILLYRLVPCGAEFFTPFSGIPRSLAFRGDYRQAARFMTAILRSGGIKPFLELHMHPDVKADFNPEGWLETYENLADFLAVNPRFKGVQSTSWFLDPALERVSPHLDYLRRVPEQAGASLFYAGVDDPEHSGAFATSRKRRALYESGQYQPRLYTRIWPRRSLLRRAWRASP